MDPASASAPTWPTPLVLRYTSEALSRPGKLPFPTHSFLRLTFNYVRMTRYLILAFALMVVSLGFKFDTRAGPGFFMIVRLTILCMFLGCLIGAFKGVHTGSTYS